MADNGDMTEHSHTYSGFVGLLKWSTIATFIVVAIVVLLIAN